MNAMRNAIITEARRWIGTPYAHQASLCGVGCDCLGLVRGVWRHIFGNEPENLIPYAPDWPLAAGDDRLHAAAQRHLREIDAAAAMPGDILLFRWRAHLPASHAAVLSAAQKMIHAHEAACVAEVHVSAWWRRHIVAAFAFPGADTTMEN